MSDGFESEIKGRQANGLPVVTVSGDVDLANASELEPSILRALEAAPGPIVVDLEALTFIDSSGLRALVSASREARSRGASLQLRNVPRHAQRVLDISGLADWFDRSADS